MVMQNFGNHWFVSYMGLQSLDAGRTFCSPVRTDEAMAQLSNLGNYGNCWQHKAYILASVPQIAKKKKKGRAFTLFTKHIVIKLFFVYKNKIFS